jgi:hypothetical protein
MASRYDNFRKKMIFQVMLFFADNLLYAKNVRVHACVPFRVPSVSCLRPCPCPCLCLCHFCIPACPSVTSVSLSVSVRKPYYVADRPCLCQCLCRCPCLCLCPCPCPCPYHSTCAFPSPYLFHAHFHVHVHVHICNCIKFRKMSYC